MVNRSARSIFFCNIFRDIVTVYCSTNQYNTCFKKKKFKEFLEYNAFIRNFNRLIKFSLHCKTNSFNFLSIDEGQDISDEIKATLGEMTLPIVLSNFSPPSPLSMRIKLDCSFELFIKRHYI